MSGDYRVDEFCRLLFEKITDESVHKELAEESVEIWKFRYNGTRTINALAKKIVPKLQVEKFGAFINDFEDHIKRNVITALKPYCPQIDENSVGLDCADLFLKIIQEAAKNYRKRRPMKISKQVADSDIDVVHIEKDLNVIIEGLSKISNTQLVALKFAAVDLSNKIEDSNGNLLGKVNWLVNTYYYYIENLFKRNETIQGNTFKLIAAEVALKYRKISGKDANNQNQIFESMVNWLKSNFPAASREACEIVISFFIQNCEVFDELP